MIDHDAWRQLARHNPGIAIYPERVRVAPVAERTAGLGQALPEVPAECYPPDAVVLPVAAPSTHPDCAYWRLTSSQCARYHLRLAEYHGRRARYYADRSVTLARRGLSLAVVGLGAVLLAQAIRILGSVVR